MSGLGQRRPLITTGHKLTEEIFVTRPDLPELVSLSDGLEEIWRSRFLTNGGQFHDRLEKVLAERFGVDHVVLMSSGTMALIAALAVTGCKGEVITTPLTFIATQHAVKILGLDPVFVDINPMTGNLDPDRIEAAITPKTKAILPVHCYGNSCEVLRIQSIANTNDLAVIYDAAQAFDVQDTGGHIVRHGDLSTLSFHATKVFHTFEGGAVVCHDAQTREKLDRFRNFGIVSEAEIDGVGLNGKMNEFSSLFGLTLLPQIDQARISRQEIDAGYREALRSIDGLTCLPQPRGQRSNYGFFPILVGDEYGVRPDELQKAFRSEGIRTRRYFFPLASSILPYRSSSSADPANLPNALDFAKRVICLPIYSTLRSDQQSRVVDILNRHQAN